MHVKYVFQQALDPRLLHVLGWQSQSGLCRAPLGVFWSGAQVERKDVENILNWQETCPQQIEIPFKPARVLLQDFTGVPCVVVRASAPAPDCARFDGFTGVACVSRVLTSALLFRSYDLVTNRVALAGSSNLVLPVSLQGIRAGAVLPNTRRCIW